ncbi:hypothetical protein Poly51_40320 [Rubripirellula tenax]|uniref:Uncharacterized protein n=1 Tax=Rubripirellula tenax TaxID=2528015 RepID=A0A5C6ETE3_9BACT|nr:hypothetical protein [Rubripirellula tenax]TWU50739.1 hypothetical protein Poly51_40320 [Rubripirellula tenax]
MADVPASITHSLKAKWHYQLTRGGVVLADLRPVDNWQHADYPCIEGTFTPTPAFDDVRSLFDRELALLESEDDDHIDEWGDIWDDLKSKPLFVQTPDEAERFDILWIHVAEDRAWWWPLYNSPDTVLPNPTA